jgi:hypothetical protein
MLNCLLQTEILIDSAGTYFEVAANNQAYPAHTPSKKLTQAQISLNDCLACRSVSLSFSFSLSFVLIVHTVGVSLLPNLSSSPFNLILRCSTFSIQMEILHLQTIKYLLSPSHLNLLPLWLRPCPLHSLLLQRSS